VRCLFVDSQCDHEKIIPLESPSRHATLLRSLVGLFLFTFILRDDLCFDVYTGRASTNIFIDVAIFGFDVCARVCGREREREREKSFLFSIVESRESLQASKIIHSKQNI